MKRLLKICIAILMTVVISQTALAGTPLYRNPRFYTIEDLIKWIETEDAENFQDGRFRNCLLSIRVKEVVYVPSFDDSNITLSHVEVLPSHASRGELIHDGKMMMLFVYSVHSSNRQIFVRVSEVNPIRINLYETEGIGGYLRVVRSEREGRAPILQREISVRDSSVGEINKIEISYSLLDSLNAPERPIASVIFILDGFELGVSFFDESQFGIMVWDMFELSTAVTPERPPSDGRPPAGGAPGGAVGGGEAGTGTPTAPERPADNYVDGPGEVHINPFEDVRSTDWFYNYVRSIHGSGLMLGTSTAPMLFSPHMALTRGMVVTILHRIAEEPDTLGKTNPFGDVRHGRWYTDAIMWAAHHDIVLGFGDGRFGPGEYITRQDLAVIFNRYAELSETELPSIRPFPNFGDGASIANYAREAVENFFRAGILNGRPGNVFDPLGRATRAESAAIIYRFIEAGKLSP